MKIINYILATLTALLSFSGISNGQIDEDIFFCSDPVSIYFENFESYELFTPVSSIPNWSPSSSCTLGLTGEVNDVISFPQDMHCDAIHNFVGTTTNLEILSFDVLLGDNSGIQCIFSGISGGEFSGLSVNLRFVNGISEIDYQIGQVRPDTWESIDLPLNSFFTVEIIQNKTIDMARLIVNGFYINDASALLGGGIATGYWDAPYNIGGECALDNISLSECPDNSLNCTNAIPLNCNEVMPGSNVCEVLPPNTVYCIPSYADVYSGCGDMNSISETGLEVLYTFTPDQDGDFSIQLDIIDPSADLDLFILSDCDATTCIGKSDIQSGSQRSITLPLNAETTYYVVVDGDRGSGLKDASEFTIQVLCQDLDCSGASTIGCNVTVLNQTVGGSLPELVYSFFAPTTNTYIIEVARDFSSFDFSDPDLKGVYSDCDLTDEISVVLLTSNQLVSRYEVTLSANQEYYIVIRGGEFDIVRDFQITVICEIGCVELDPNNYDWCFTYYPGITFDDDRTYLFDFFSDGNAPPEVQNADPESIIWTEIKSSEEVPLGTGTLVEYRPNIQGTISITVCVEWRVYEGEIERCYRLCKTICFPVDPLRCMDNNFWWYPSSEIGDEYTVVAQENLEVVSWELHDKNNTLEIQSGNEAKFSIPESLYPEGTCLWITLTYYDGQCLRVCCKKICITNRYCGGTYVDPLYIGSEQEVNNFDYRYRFEHTLPSGSQLIKWKAFPLHDPTSITESEDDTFEPSAFALNPLLEQTIYRICIIYFEDGCYKICCIDICLNNPYGCGTYTDVECSDDVYYISSTPDDNVTILYWTDADGNRLDQYDGLTEIIYSIPVDPDRRYVYCYYAECKIDDEPFADFTTESIPYGDCWYGVCCIPLPDCCVENCCDNSDSLIELTFGLDCNSTIFQCRYNGLCVYNVFFDNPETIDEEGGQVFDCSGELLFAYNFFTGFNIDLYDQLLGCQLIWNCTNGTTEICLPDCIDYCCDDANTLINLTSNLTCSSTVFQCKYNGLCVYNVFFDNPETIDEEGGQVFDCSGELIFAYNFFTDIDMDLYDQLLGCQLIWNCTNGTTEICLPDCIDYCCDDANTLINLTSNLTCSSTVFQCKYNGLCVYNVFFDNPETIDEEGGQVFDCSGELLFAYNFFTGFNIDLYDQLLGCQLIWNCTNGTTEICLPDCIDYCCQNNSTLQSLVNSLTCSDFIFQGRYLGECAYEVRLDQPVGELDISAFYIGCTGDTLCVVSPFIDCAGTFENSQLVWSCSTDIIPDCKECITLDPNNYDWCFTYYPGLTFDDDRTYLFDFFSDENAPLEVQNADPESIVWTEIKSSEEVPLGTGTLVEYRPNIQGTISITVCVEWRVYEGEIERCYRLCKTICFPVDPLRCMDNNFWWYPLSEIGDEYTVVAQENLEVVSWELHDENNTLEIQSGTEAKFSIPESLYPEGTCLWITLTYYDGHCLRVCCKKICITNRYCGGTYVDPLYIGSEQEVNNFDYRYRFKHTLPSGSQLIKWKAFPLHDPTSITESEDDTFEPSAFALNPLLEQTIYRICIIYFEDRCYKICCIDICLNNPYGCGTYTDIECSNDVYYISSTPDDNVTILYWTDADGNRLDQYDGLTEIIYPIPVDPDRRYVYCYYAECKIDDGPFADFTTESIPYGDCWYGVCCIPLPDCGSPAAEYCDFLDTLYYETFNGYQEGQTIADQNRQWWVTPDPELDAVIGNIASTSLALNFSMGYQNPTSNDDFTDVSLIVEADSARYDGYKIEHDMYLQYVNNFNNQPDSLTLFNGQIELHVHNSFDNTVHIELKFGADYNTETNFAELTQVVNSAGVETRTKLVDINPFLPSTQISGDIDKYRITWIWEPFTQQLHFFVDGVLWYRNQFVLLSLPSPISYRLIEEPNGWFMEIDNLCLAICIPNLDNPCPSMSNTVCDDFESYNTGDSISLQDNWSKPLASDISCVVKEENGNKYLSIIDAPTDHCRSQYDIPNISSDSSTDKFSFDVYIPEGGGLQSQVYDNNNGLIFANFAPYNSFDTLELNLGLKAIIFDYSPDIPVRYNEWFTITYVLDKATTDVYFYLNDVLYKLVRNTKFEYFEIAYFDSALSGNTETRIDNVCISTCETCIDYLDTECEDLTISKVIPEFNGNVSIDFTYGGSSDQIEYWSIVDVNNTSDTATITNTTGNNIRWSHFIPGHTYRICVWYRNSMGCLVGCCILVEIPTNCNIYTPYFTNNSATDVQYEFVADNIPTGYEVLLWSVDSEDTNEFSTNEIMRTFSVGDTRYVCCLVFNPTTKRYILCCRAICVLPPLECGSLSIDYDPISGTYSLFVSEASSILSWRIDEPIRALIGENNPQVFNPSDFALTSEQVLISVRYLDADGCLKICCRRICISELDTQPSCGLFEVQYTEVNEQIVFDISDQNPSSIIAGNTTEVVTPDGTAQTLTGDEFSHDDLGQYIFCRTYTTSCDFDFTCCDTICFEPVFVCQDDLFSYTLDENNARTVHLVHTAIDASSLTWDFGDGETSEDVSTNIDHTFSGTNNMFEICLTLNTLCQAACQICKEINLGGNEVLTIKDSITHANCQGESDGAIMLNITGGQSPYEILWNTGSTDQSLSGLAPGDYTVKVTDAAGDSSEHNYTIGLLSMTPDIQVAITESMCGSPTGAIRLTILNEVLIESYNWANGLPDTPEILDLSPGIYNVTMTDIHGCKFLNEYEVGSNEDLAVDINFLENYFICAAEEITVSSGISNEYILEWYLNGVLQEETSPNISISVAGDLELQIFTLDRVCMASEMTTIEFFQSDVVFPENISVESGEAFELEVTGDSEVIWESDLAEFSCTRCNLTSVTLFSSDSITVNATDVNGCILREKIFINVDSESIFKEINLITPNGDGYNDILFFEGIENFAYSRLIVFNKWGDIIFKSTSNYQNEFDGRINGKLLRNAGYYYVLEYGENEVNHQRIRSDLTILSD